MVADTPGRYLPNKPPEQKPPLGILPRDIFDKTRACELLAAAIRYHRADKPIPIEWLEEALERVTPKDL